MITIVLGIAVAVFVLIVFLLSSYTVIKPNQAHVVTRMGFGRHVYSPIVGADGQKTHKTAYFFIPFLMKRQILDLTNVKLEVKDIDLRDKDAGPFNCDIVCWFHVVDPSLAAERLDLDHENGTFGSVTESLLNLVPAVAREAAMKQSILEIMRDRNTFGESVEDAVEREIEKWGVEMIDLEINDMHDADGSTIIENYELIQQTKVETDARKQNAERRREAIEVEQDNREKAEVRTAQVEENVRKRQIDKDKAIGISLQEQELEIARARELANQQQVSATRTLEIGNATIAKDARITLAIGEGEAIRIKGEKEAEVTKLTGVAEADVILAQGTAEAEAKAKMAEALKAFNESGITLEQIKAFVEVQKSKFSSLASAFQAANINLTSSDPQKIFGFGLDAEGGAALGTFIKQLETMTGKSVTELAQDVKNTVTGKGKA